MTGGNGVGAGCTWALVGEMKACVIVSTIKVKLKNDNSQHNGSRHALS